MIWSESSRTLALVLLTCGLAALAPGVARALDQPQSQAQPQVEVQAQPAAVRHAQPHKAGAPLPKKRTLAPANDTAALANQPQVQLSVHALTKDDVAALPAASLDEVATSSKLVENQLQINEVITGAPILSKRGMPLIESLDPAVKLNLTMREVVNGADLTFEFTNTAAALKPLGSINLGVLTLGNGITYTDLRKTSETPPVDANTFVGKSFSYPGEFYSPTMVLSGNNATVGISVQYPVLEYAHDLRIGLMSPSGPLAAGEGGRGWAVKLQFAASKTQAMKNEAKLRPKETRTYVVSIRVVRARDQWARTLLPYREFFQKTYGQARYERSVTPTLALSLADDSQITADNPQGWTQWRPDLWGFSKLSRALRMNYSGWPSITLTNTGGLFKSHRDLNPPFQFASIWASTPLLASATEVRNGLPSVPQTGKKIGLWWGNSARVMTDWDPAGAVDFDPAKTDHVKAALAELDAAVQTNATTITLGNFTHDRTPIWKQYQWVQDLGSRYPNIKFVIEPAACDVMHTIAPSVVQGVADQGRPAREADLYTITHPNYMADFLVPGHETWATFHYRGMKQFFNTEPDDARIISDMQAYASYGYVPCFFVDRNVDATMTASATWESTIPTDLQQGAPEFAAKPQLNTNPSATATPSTTNATTTLANAGAPTANATNTKAAADAPETLKAILKKFRGVVVRRADEMPSAEWSSNPLATEPTEMLVEDALRRARAMSGKAAIKDAKLRPTRVTTAEKPVERPAEMQPGGNHPK